MMYNRIWSNQDRMGNRHDDACDAYNIFGNGNGVEAEPYSYGDNIDQDQVVFSERYIQFVHEGLMTGDISGMNSKEKQTFKEFVDYEDGFDDHMNYTMPSYFTGDDEYVATSLDECLVQAVYGNETVQCSDNGCGIESCCHF